jgi:hypothetical protein
MSRLLLLGLADADVDILSRIPSLDPQPEILVVHSDPEALIVRLAKVADLPTATKAPKPKQGDVVVIPSQNGDRLKALLDPWKRAGARIIDPGSLIAEVGPTKDEGPETLPKPQPEEVSKMDALQPRTFRRKKTSKGQYAASLKRAKEQSKTPKIAKTEAPPPDIWVHPEATFRYLVESAGGKERAMTLWWDGGEDHWVPWLWTGEIPQGEAEPLTDGLEIPSSWGAFRLIGGEDVHDELNLGALTRVADDLALRDLAAWRQAERELVDVGMPDPEDEDGLETWAERVLSPLNSEAAMIWKQGDDAWRLQGTWGESVVFSGDLVFSDSLFSATFDGPGTRWYRWDLGAGFCVQLMLSEDDPRWPLRFHRVKRAVMGEVDTW